MRSLLREGLDLAQQIAALPFRAAREALRDSRWTDQPLGEVVEDSLFLGEGLAKLPFKATLAAMDTLRQSRPDLEERVAELERRLGVTEPPAPEAPAPEVPAPNANA